MCKKVNCFHRKSRKGLCIPVSNPLTIIKIWIRVPSAESGKYSDAADGRGQMREDSRLAELVFVLAIKVLEKGDVWYIEHGWRIATFLWQQTQTKNTLLLSDDLGH